jgi:hypothetical protein
MTLPHGLVLLGLLLLAAHTPDDPPRPGAAQDAEEKAARMEYMKRAAKGYEITPAADAAKKLVLTEGPLLRFDDPVTGVVDGTQFVWMLGDRPAATASVWVRNTGHEFHEFQSLADGPLTASNQGQTKWAPQQPGVEWKPAPDAPPPAATAVGRLAQMRAMAREYRATVTASEKDQQELRLLPQPFFRYGRPDGAVADGAMFAYCKGTNPEVLLLVEATKKGQGLEWGHAFARMTTRACEVRRGDRVVWTAPRLRRGNPTDPYFNVVQRYQGPGAKAPAPDKDE